MEETITVVCIMDCPTITVHAGKCYKALIDSGATISIFWYSTYKNIQDSYKTPIQPTIAKLNTADGSPTTALGMTALHLRIVEFKFTHNFCNLQQTLGYRDYFWHRYPKEVFSFIHLGQGKELLYTKRWQIPNLHHKTVNRRQQLAQLNQYLKYQHDTMVSYQLK